jgi:hypothetical protein
LDWIKATYCGYKHVKISRQVIFIKPEYWVLIDYIEGSGEHEYEQYFHFHNEINLAFKITDQSVVAENCVAKLKIVPLKTDGLTGEIIKNEFSPGYGEIKDAHVLRYKKNGVSPQLFVTVLYPFNDQNAELANKLQIEQIKVNEKNSGDLSITDSFGLKILFEGYEDLLVFSANEKKCFCFEGLEMTGKLIFMRKVGNLIIKEKIMS